MFALLDENNKVVQIQEDVFDVAKSMKWVYLASQSPVRVGYVYDGQNFAEVVPTIREIDDIFRRAVKRIIVAILKYLNGNITKVELGVVYNEVKDLLENVKE